MSSDLREAEAALPWQTANERTLEDKALRADAAAQGDKGYTGKWFVCHGTGPNVPKFLRFAGKVCLPNSATNQRQFIIRLDLMLFLSEGSQPDDK
eukprot:SAG31_NODE_1399_length_8500_cov_22.401857_8_plen_95_part_00